MPTYVYGCDACGHRFEKFQKFSDDPIRVCPECQSNVRRIFQPAGIVFKGSGWHVTDYKRSGGSNGAEAAKESDSGAASNGSAKSETSAAETPAAAPAAKTETASSSTANASAPAKTAS